VKFLETQGVDDEIEEGVKLVRELAEYAGGCKRTPCPLSDLVVGLKCGGSDGFSGITANPLVGLFSDRLVASGGTTVLTEVPEMFGAETILMNRAKDKAVFDKIVSLITISRCISKPITSRCTRTPPPATRTAASPPLRTSRSAAPRRAATPPRWSMCSATASGRKNRASTC
jgi:altronate hydrolase